MLFKDRRETRGMKRETFGSRIGFILVSAGCAIGIGNVWKFPYLCGEYGGAAFILITLSVVLTLLGGLIPSKKAAKSDPVAALRAE